MESALLEVNMNLHKELYSLNKKKESLLRVNKNLLKENEIKDETIDKKQDIIEELSNKLILQKIETEHYSNLKKKIETKNKEIIFDRDEKISKLIECIYDATSIETLKKKLSVIL
jgi:hypothetical protein